MRIARAGLLPYLAMWIKYAGGQAAAAIELLEGGLGMVARPAPQVGLHADLAGRDIHRAWPPGPVRGGRPGDPPGGREPPARRDAARLQSLAARHRGVAPPGRRGDAGADPADRGAQGPLVVPRRGGVPGRGGRLPGPGRAQRAGPGLPAPGAGRPAGRRAGDRHVRGRLLARHGDPVLAEEKLLAAPCHSVSPREYWRITLLRAYAAFRRGEADAGALAARAFEEAARLGLAHLPYTKEGMVTGELLGLAVRDRPARRAGPGGGGAAGVRCACSAVSR